MPEEKKITVVEAEPVEAPEAPSVEVSAEPQAPELAKYRQRLKSRYADAEPQSDAEWDDLAEKYMAEDEERLKIFDENAKVIDDILYSDKDLARVVAEMITNGTPFRAALAKFFDADSLTPKEGDEDYDYYQKSRDERIQQGKDLAKRIEERRANEEAAYSAIDAYCEKKAYDEVEKNALIDYINNYFAALAECKITEEMLQQFDNARNYDKDVAEAAEEAEIDARNEAIEARRASEAAQRSADGVPSPAGGSTPARQKAKKEENPFFAGIRQRNAF